MTELTREEKVEELSVEIWRLRNTNKNEFKRDVYYNVSDYLEELGNIEEFWKQVANKDVLEMYIGDTDYINEALESYGPEINEILINEYMKPRKLKSLTEIEGFNDADLLVLSLHNRRLLMWKVLDLVITDIERRIKGEEGE